MKREDAKVQRIGPWLGTLLLCVFALNALPGCATTTARNIAADQKPGTASGAGASVTGPTNSAAPTTQTAKRITRYPAPRHDIALPKYNAQTAATPAQPDRVKPVAAPEPSEPTPESVEEEVSTSIGQHQDVGTIVQVATSAGKWGKMRWIGILLIVAGAFGLAWAHGNPEGYPVICWKVGGIGVFLAMFDPSPWWLALLLIPAGFYLAQKLGLLRIPLP